MIRDPHALLGRIRAMHAAIRDAVTAACEQTAAELLAAPVAEEGGDTIFAIDRVSEQVLLEHFSMLARERSLVLVAEGLGSDGLATLPAGTDEALAELRIIVDPIDGTRGLMYQKRPAWILTGVAPNRGRATSLADIELAVMTEIPLVKQHLCDSLWALAGQGAAGERLNRLTGQTQPLTVRPTQAHTIAQGYGGIARFFPGERATLAAIDDALVERLLGPLQAGSAPTFEDQYISTGGQLYELLMGHDRWIADLRPLAEALLNRRGRALGLCCHPYDLCTELIAREASVIVTDALGGRLDAPLDVGTPMAWVGFANQALAEQVGPALRDLLREHGLLPAS
jgi:hypothetical protein